MTLIRKASWSAGHFDFVPNCRNSVDLRCITLWTGVSAALGSFASVAGECRSAPKCPGLAYQRSEEGDQIVLQVQRSSPSWEAARNQRDVSARSFRPSVRAMFRRPGDPDDHACVGSQQLKTSESLYLMPDDHEESFQFFPVASPTFGKLRSIGDRSSQPSPSSYKIRDTKRGEVT